MKLADLDIIVTSPPAPGWGGRYWILVKVTTACGIVGWGEVYAASVGPEAMRTVIADVFARHMEGESPENIELMFRRAYSAGFTQRPDLTVMGAFSGLEMACWDIIGKARERPVWAMIGGRTNDRLRAYTYLYPEEGMPLPEFWNSPEMAAEVALKRAEEGWTAVKFDPAGPYTVRGGHEPSVSDISRSVAFCEQIRAAVCDRADLLFGTHGQFSVSGALRMGRAIAHTGPLWFEEPVPPDNVGAMAKVASGQPVPVATGERLTTKAEFAPVLREGAAQILQPALGRVGGIGEARKVAAMAEVYNVTVAPHLYAGPVEFAANIALGVAIPNLLMVECIETAFHRDLVKGAIRVEDGHVIPPEGPGLGIEVDEELARAHPWEGEGLHLEMQDGPCRYDAPNAFEGGAPR